MNHAMKTTLPFVLIASALATTSARAASPSDSRCEGGISRAAKHFSAKALPGKNAHDRYLEFVRTCGRNETVELAKSLIRFRTVSADETGDFAPQLAGMSKFLAGWAKSHGFSFHAIGSNDVFELGWGKGADPKLALVFHGDVVPAPKGEWKKDPFTPVVEDGRLYGRGSEDDKGPLASGLVSLAMAKAVGLKPDGRVLIVVGNGEEHDWTAMQKYAESAKKFANTISVDSGFPVMAAQSGFVAWTLSAPMDAQPTTGDGPRFVDASAGEFLTQVPGTATLTIAPGPNGADALIAQIKATAAELAKTRKDFHVDPPELRDGKIVITTHGNAVHASAADHGHNALWDLAALASKLKGIQPNGLSALLHTVANRFDGDHNGHKLGVFYEDSLMGPMLVAPTVLRVEKGVASLSTNMRRPQGRDNAQFEKLLDAAAAAIARDTHGVVTEAKDQRHVSEPHLADVSGSLVTTLLDIYKNYRGGDGLKPGSIRGGTYGRLFPRGVDFGPSFPGESYTGHAPDESISIEDLDLTTQMVSEALYRIALVH